MVKATLPALPLPGVVPADLPRLSVQPGHSLHESRVGRDAQISTQQLLVSPSRNHRTGAVAGRHQDPNQREGNARVVAVQRLRALPPPDRLTMNALVSRAPGEALDGGDHPPRILRSLRVTPSLESAASFRKNPSRNGPR